MRSTLAIVFAFAILSCFRCDASADQVVLRDGSVLDGEIQGREANYVLVKVTQGGESAHRRLRPDAIERIHFSDTDWLSDLSLADGEADAHLEEAAARRSPLLGLLDARDERLLIRLLERYLATQRAPEALAYAKVWRDRVSDPGVSASVATILIQAARAAGQVDEARFHAQAWIDSGRDASASSLAWAVVAQSQLDFGDARGALWTSAQPIAFVADPAPADLAECYRIAIEAACALGQAAYAEQLRVEMADRGFAPGLLAKVHPLQPLIADDARPFESLLQLHGNP